VSLLLEALKRAEDKGRRRHGGLGPGGMGTSPTHEAAPGAGNEPLPHFDPQDAEPSFLPVELTSAPPVDGFDPAPAAAWEPELAPTSRPAPLAPQPAAPPAAERPAAAPFVPEVPRGGMPRPTPTRARSADRLLHAQARPTAGGRRQVWLLAAVTMVGAGVAALWFWPEEAPPARQSMAQGSAPAPQAAPDGLGPSATGSVGAQHAAAPAPPQDAAAPLAGTLPATVPMPASSGTRVAAGEVAGVTPLPPTAPAPAAPVAAVAPVTPVATAPAAPAVATTASPNPPAAAVAAAPAPAVPSVRTSRPAAAVAARAPAPAAAAASAAAPGAAPQSSPRQVVAAQLQRQLQQAYTDFQAGRTQEATQAWREVVRSDPTQRDAWLGLAISAHRQGHFESAVAGYQQVLRLDPENGEALGALAALGGSGSDMASESRLRDALARNPGNAMLNSALARLLSTQSRWDEAQPFWFAAHAAAPDQPTHAYNLAVALDRLRKTTLAAQYYRKALALQEGQAVTFDAAAARARLQALDDVARAGAP
jgi:Tfp pilus assembly protein PilF